MKIEDAINYDTKIVVEEMVKNLTEVNISVLGDYEKQDFKTLRYDFIKLVVGNTEDTVFYKYDDFWNRYNFPFVPMSYYNANKNEYPRNKYSNDDLSLATYDRNSNYAFIPKNLVGEKLYLPILTQENYERLFNGTRLYNYDDDSRKYSFEIGRAHV